MTSRIESFPIEANLPLAEVLAELPFDQQGLVAAISQQFDTDEVLLLAWMNRAAIDEALATGFACYWFCSRQTLWCKGETAAVGKGWRKPASIGMATPFCCWSTCSGVLPIQGVAVVATTRSKAIASKSSRHRFHDLFIKAKHDQPKQ